MWLFALAAAVAVLGGVCVITARHPITSVLALVATLFGVAMLFVLLEAHFVAVVQLVVYAGAVMVLFLFVVMMLNLEPEAVARTGRGLFRMLGLVLGVAFLFGVGAIVRSAGRTLPADGVGDLIGTIQVVGRSLLTTYLLPFEIVSVLLLVAVIGAVVLARKP